MLLKPAGRLFEVCEGGDPYSNAWDVSEYEGSWAGACFYRGDLSGRWDRDGLLRRLRRDFPGCAIRFRAGYEPVEAGSDWSEGVLGEL